MCRRMVFSFRKDVMIGHFLPGPLPRYIPEPRVFKPALDYEVRSLMPCIPEKQNHHQVRRYGSCHSSLTWGG